MIYVKKRRGKIDLISYKYFLNIWYVLRVRVPHITLHINRLWRLARSRLWKYETLIAPTICCACLTSLTNQDVWIQRDRLWILRRNEENYLANANTVANCSHRFLSANDPLYLSLSYGATWDGSFSEQSEWVIRRLEIFLDSTLQNCELAVVFISFWLSLCWLTCTL